MRTPLRFLKGHGTENDFLLIPDADGAAGPLDPQLVRALCDRHAGLGADGVIRVVRTEHVDDPAARDQTHHRADDEVGPPSWFMDYRNSDGSLSEMCGNGVRVLGRYLVTHEDVDPSRPLPIATRAGTKVLTFEGGEAPAPITVDMGSASVRGTTWVEVAGQRWEATHVDLGNPHAVAFVEDLADAGPLLEEPRYDDTVFPHGVNIEFVVRRGPGEVAMRVHERGSGETRSCGTGACAVMVASALADGRGIATGESAAGRGDSPEDPCAYSVQLPGGTLEVQWTEDGRLLMTGPAVLVAEGYWFA